MSKEKTLSKKEKFYDNMKVLFWSLGFIIKSNPLFTLAFIGLSIVQGLLPIFAIQLTKIVIDNINLNPKEVAYYENYVDNYNTLSTYKPFNDDLYHYTIEYEDFFIPLETCIFRDSFRDSPIGKEIITNTYNKYKDIINEHNK